MSEFKENLQSVELPSDDKVEAGLATNGVDVYSLKDIIRDKLYNPLFTIVLLLSVFIITIQILGNSIYVSGPITRCFDIFNEYPITNCISCNGGSSVIKVITTSFGIVYVGLSCFIVAIISMVGSHYMNTMGTRFILHKVFLVNDLIYGLITYLLIMFILFGIFSWMFVSQEINIYATLICPTSTLFSQSLVPNESSIWKKIFQALLFLSTFTVVFQFISSKLLDESYKFSTLDCLKFKLEIHKTIKYSDLIIKMIQILRIDYKIVNYSATIKDNDNIIIYSIKSLIMINIIFLYSDKFDSSNIKDIIKDLSEKQNILEKPRRSLYDKWFSSYYQRILCSNKISDELK